MANSCPKCNSELRGGARFCDNCGAPVGEAPAAGGAAQNAGNTTNWKAILIVVVIIVVVGWLLFGPNSRGGNGEMAGSGDNPHATGGDPANPHGGMDQGMEMGDITAQIADAKASLEQNPLDTDSLAVLYQMFGMIGRQSQLTPYVETALATLEEEKDSLGPEKTDEIVRGIVTAALGAGDADGGMMALEKYAEIDSENTRTMAMLGDLNYDLGNHDKAIEWYTKYLNESDQATEGDLYWNAKADRATMFLQRFDDSGNADDVVTAVIELEAILAEIPGHWGAWFNLGHALLASGDESEAAKVWEEARDRATSPMQVWQAEVELAELRGEEPPPMPGGEANPHGGMGGSMGGGMGSVPEGVPNPHGGMGGS